MGKELCHVDFGEDWVLSWNRLDNQYQCGNGHETDDADFRCEVVKVDLVEEES